uniref:Uncharacterized protein n=1 Tax=Panagrolaimus sp. ES5 TaxID=591445 RepID=A0AC34FYK4_9BILA
MLKKPDYEIQEEIKNGIKNQHIIIFDPANRELCYEYRIDNFPQFKCLGCSQKKKGRNIKLYNYGKEDEYVQIDGKDHVCELRPYIKDKFAKKEEWIIQKPDFKIEVTELKGKESKTLIVLDSNDKNYCFQYGICHKRFLCKQCLKQDHKVYAKLEKDKDGNEYLRHGPESHICEPKLYIPANQKEVILDSTKFEFIATRSGTRNILLYHENDKNLCYRFQYHNGYYTCSGCLKKKFYLLIRLCQKDDGEYFIIKSTTNTKHICEPQKYNPNMIKKIVTVPKSKVIFYRSKQNKLRFALFLDEEKKLCYDYRESSNAPNAFKCS